MAQFLLFVKERVPLAPYALFAILISLAPYFLLNLKLNFLSLAISFFGILLLLIQMRLLDDIQDAPIDKIAHKDRPLATGEISINDGERMGGILQLGLLVFSALILLTTSYTAFFFYLASAVYIWNNYKGFYFEEWMRNHPFTAFFLSELVFFPIIFFSFAMADEKKAFDDISIAFSFLLFSALIIYDIARKLDPKSHPILQSFVHLMGYRRVFLALMPVLFVSFMIAEKLGLALILWPVQFAALVSLAMVLFGSFRWHFAATVALLSLFIHAASPLLLYSLEKLPFYQKITTSDKRLSVSDWSSSPSSISMRNSSLEEMASFNPLSSSSSLETLMPLPDLTSSGNKA